MKVLEEIKVSVYENVYSKKPRVMSFLEVIIMCIHPIYASIINAISGTMQKETMPRHRS